MYYNEAQKYRRGIRTLKRLISLVAVILVSINFTTTLVGSNYDVIADTIETLTSDESQDQEDPDTSETVPETEESDETDVTESSLSEETAETTFATDPSETVPETEESDETDVTESSLSEETAETTFATGPSEIVPTPVPAPSPEDIAEALYPSVLTEFETTAPDGTVLSISGVFPQTSYAEAELFENDSVGRVIKGYDADLIIPEGCSLTDDPVTVSFPFTCDEQFAVVAFADGTTPVVNDAYEYQDGVITITLDALCPFVIAEISDPVSDSALMTVAADIYTDDTFTETLDGVSVSITGVLQEGITAKAYPVEDADDSVITSYDITLFDGDGNVHQPENGAVSVTISDESIREAMESGIDITVEHEAEDGSVDTVEISVLSDTSVTFNAESFSVYRVRAMYEDSLDGVSGLIMGINSYNMPSGQFKHLIMTQTWGKHSNSFPGSFFQSVNVNNSLDLDTGFITDDPNENLFAEWTFEKADIEASVEDYPNANITLAMKNGPSRSFSFTDTNRPQLYYIKAANGQYLKFDYDNQSSNGYYQGFYLVDEPTPLIVVFDPSGSGEFAIGSYNPGPRRTEYTFIRARDNSNTTVSQRGFEQCGVEKKESGYWLSIAQYIPGDKAQIAYDYNPVSDTGNNTIRSFDHEIEVDITDPDAVVVVEAPDPSLGNSNNGWFYESTGKINYRYKFKCWKDPVTGNEYNPGDEISVSDLAGFTTLKAQWEEEYEYIKVVYDLNFGDRGDLPEDIPGYDEYFRPVVVGYDGTEYDIIYKYPEGSGHDNTYLVRSLDKDYFNYASNSQDERTRHVKFSALFNGWKSEKGNIITQPGVCDAATFFDNIANFDGSPSDGVVTLKANWLTNMSNTATFSLMQNVIEVNGDPEDVDNTVGTHTFHVLSTGVRVSDISRVSTTAESNYFLAPYTDLGDGPLRTSGVDELLRQAAVAPITGDPMSRGADPRDYSDVTLQLTDMISDEEVFELLRQWAQEDLENGTTKNTFYYVDENNVKHPIAPEDLDTDHYSVRWYVIKYQGRSGGWRVDGKLVKNGSYIAVHKSFIGIDQATIDSLADDYFINVYESDDDSLDPNDYHLVLRSSGDPLSDKISDDGTLVEYGYRSYDPSTHTYTWIVQVEDEGSYTVFEENFAVPNYGVIAQYSVETLDGEGDVPLRQWDLVDIQAKALKVPVDQVTAAQINKAHLRNTYVKYGTFTIEKVETDVNGTAMGNVGFNVYDVTEETLSSAELLEQIRNGTYNKDPFIFKWNAEEGLWEPDSRVVGAQITTDENGKLCFKIPVDAAGDEKRYIVVENVPEGYEDSVVPSFEIIATAAAIDEDNVIPNYTVNLLEDSEHMTPMLIPIYNDEDQKIADSFAWITVKNVPEEVTVKITSNETYNNDAGVINFTANIVGRYADTDEVFVSDSVVINRNYLNSETGNWEYTKQYPAMNGNRQIYYTVTETGINGGPPDEEIWEVNKTDDYLIAEGVHAQSEKDPLVRLVESDINHVLKDVPMIIIQLGNYTYADKTVPMEGAKLKVYKEDPNGDQDVFFINSTRKADLIRSITVDDTGMTNLGLFPGTYYIEQSSVFGDFNLNAAKVKITITDDLRVVMEKAPPSTRLVEITNTADLKKILFFNTRVPPVPTGYISYMSPMLILLAGGVALLLILRNRKERGVRRVKNIKHLKEVVGSL